MDLIPYSGVLKDMRSYGLVLNFL